MIGSISHSQVFLNVSSVAVSSRNISTPAWYSLASRHDPNLPQLGTPVGVKKRATIQKIFDRVLSTTRVAKSLNLKQESSTVRKRSAPSLFQRLKGITVRETDRSYRMLVMRPKVPVVREATPTDCDSSDYHQQLPPNRHIIKEDKDTLFNNYPTNGRTVEVEAVVEPHAYQSAWGLETELHKKPNPELNGFEVRQEQLLGSPSSGYTSVHQSETSSTNRNSGFSNYSTSSTESPDVMWHEVDDTNTKCSTMIRRSCSMNNLPMMGASSEYQTIQDQSRKHSHEILSSDEAVNDFHGLKPKQRSQSVEILIDTDSSSTELSQTDPSCAPEDTDADQLTREQKPENLIMSFKMKYSAVQQPSAPHKSRMFFIKAKKIRAPFRLFRNKHASNSSQANKTALTSRYNVKCNGTVKSLHLPVQ